MNVIEVMKSINIDINDNMIRYMIYKRMIFHYDIFNKRLRKLIIYGDFYTIAICEDNIIIEGEGIGYMKPGILYMKGRNKINNEILSIIHKLFWSR